MATSKPSAALIWYVLSTLDHDGRRYEPGDSVQLDEATAAVLQPLGVVSRVSQVADELPG
jgi:hypothetical protein